MPPSVARWLQRLPFFNILVKISIRLYHTEHSAQFLPICPPLYCRV